MLCTCTCVCKASSGSKIIIIIRLQTCLLPVPELVVVYIPVCVHGIRSLRTTQVQYIYLPHIMWSCHGHVVVRSLV